MSAQAEVLIPLHQIDVAERLREVDPEGVELIRISMAERGLINPISVRPAKGGGYLLIAGAHRLEAARQLFAAGDMKWASIRATVDACDDDEAELREIEENLCRKELSPYDYAEFAARWWMVRDRQGENKHGGDRRSKLQIANLKTNAKKPRFFQEMATKIGVSEATVRRAVKRRIKLSDEIWASLKGTDAAKKGVLLDKLQRLKNPEAIKAIIATAKRDFDGKIEPVLQAKTKLQEKKTPSTATMLARIEACWPEWNAAQRKTFLSGIKGLAK